MIRINLLPHRISRRQEMVRRELALAGLGALGLLGFLLVVEVAQAARVNALRAKNEDLRQYIEQRKEVVAKVEEMERLKAEYQRKLDVICQLRANKKGPVHMLAELADATPEKVQLQSLDESGGRVELTGVAVSNEVISEFLSNLEKSEYFQDVYLNAIDQVEKDGVKLKSFSVTARLVVPGAKRGQEPAAAGKGRKAKARKR